MEIFRALAALAEPPGPEQVRLGRLLDLPGEPDPAHYTETFLFQLYPYASVYLGAEGMLGGDAQDRVAGFWRALNLTPPAEPDHLTVLLALYATLAGHEESEPDPARKLLWGQSRKALLWEHLACWLFLYLEKQVALAPPFYRAWGELLREVLTAEIESLGPPDALPLHLRQAPSLPDPREEGSEAFLEGLLAPVRSGMLLVRADVARAGRELGLGMRLGERRFMLQALFGQDAAALLGWLHQETKAWAARHGEQEHLLGDLARFWAGRAEATATLLADLESLAQEVERPG